MAGLSDFYRQLEAAGRLPSVYSGNGSMRAQSGDPFVEGFMDGRNIRNSVLAEKEALEDRERAKQMMDQARNTWYQGDYTRGQIPDSPYPVTQSQMGDNPLGKPLGQVLYEGLSGAQGAQNGAQTSPAKTDYSFPARQGAEPMDTTFQNAMPTEQNGFHLGSYPQTEMYGDPQDWQRQMVRNAAGLNGEQRWFNPSGFGAAISKAQNTIPAEQPQITNAQKTVTDLGNGKTQINMSGTIKGQVPESPVRVPGADAYTAKGFSPAQGKLLANRAQKLQNMRDSLNPTEPSSDNTAALAGEGTGISANDLTRPQTIDEYLGRRFNVPQFGADYGLQQWMRDDRAHGVTDPFVSLMRYQMFIDPIVKQAREDDLRNAFLTYQNPKATPEERNNAIAKMEFYLHRPGIGSDLQRREDEYYEKRGMMRNPDLSDVDSEYGGDDENARTIYAHLASKGLPANVIAGIMGNLQQESGFDSNAYNPNDGDGSPSGGIAQWHASRLDNLRNFASQRGADWNNLGTQLDFLLQEMNDRDPSLVQRMAKLSPHEAALLFHKEFEISNDTPEQAAQRGINASNIFNGRRQKPRYVKDPNFVSPKERFDAEQAYKERALGIRENRINNRSVRLNPNANTKLSGLVDRKGKLILPYDADSAVDEAIESLGNGFKAIEANGNGDLSGQVNSLANSLSPVYKYLTENGMGEQQAKSVISNLLDEKMNKFDKELAGKIGAKRKRDIIERIVTGQKDELQKRNTRHYSEENKSAGKGRKMIDSPRVYIEPDEVHDYGDTGDAGDTSGDNYFKNFILSKPNFSVRPNSNRNQDLTWGHIFR